MAQMTAPVNALACQRWSIVTELAWMVRFHLITRDFRRLICGLVCGNGVVTGSEECDRGLGCNNVTCKCMPGYQPYVNKQDCQPIPPQFIPSVGPSLDCLNIIDSNSMMLYFSFVNNNGFDLNIPYGLMNNFVPNNLAVSC